MNLETILTLFALVTGVVAVFQLLEYIFTKNLPWLARLLRRWWRWQRRRFQPKGKAAGQRYLVLNFSSHPLLPGRQQAIQARLGWPAVEVIEAGLDNIGEGKAFVAELLRYVENIPLTPEEWQSQPLVVVAAGYAPAWAVILAELHGRLGYFPDMVRLRPAKAEEKFELAEIISLRDIRNQARSRR
jgi:hypothetical protein